MKPVRPAVRVRAGSPRGSGGTPRRFGTPAGAHGLREPVGLMRVAVPDYLRFGVPSTARLFGALTRYPSLQRLLALSVPTLVVLGDRDPLLPAPGRIREIASRFANPILVVVIEGAAHAINFRHPGELANVIRRFMADRPIVDDPDSTGFARDYEVHRGVQIPVVEPSDPHPG